jgi:hypothetical protein
MRSQTSADDPLKMGRSGLGIRRLTWKAYQPEPILFVFSTGVIIKITESSYNETSIYLFYTLQLYVNTEYLQKENHCKGEII